MTVRAARQPVAECPPKLGDVVTGGHVVPGHAEHLGATGEFEGAARR
jgi:hypothetical protein